MTTPDIPTTMKVYSASAALLCEFPSFTNLQVLDTVNNVGSFTFNWSLNSPNGSLLISDSDLQMAVCMDFRDGNGYQEVWRGIYESDTYDPSMNESAIIQAGGRSMVAILDQAVVYPKAGVGSTNTSWSFTGTSPGGIMHDLLVAAQARGCFPTLTWSFTSGQDSSGAAWTHGWTNSISAGTSYLQVLLGLSQGGLCDFKMVGTRLDMYNPKTTLATDRSTTVFFRRSRDIIGVPAQRDRTNIGTAMLAVGDNGVNVEVTASTLGTLGRREKYLAQSGVTDTSSLTYFANQAIAAVDDQQLSYTPTQIFKLAEGSHIPWKDFFPGDYVSLDTTGTADKFRVTQWTIQVQPGGPTMFQPTLNDVFYDREVLIQKAVNGLTSGTVTGAGGLAIGGGRPPIAGPNPTIPGVPAFQPSNCYTAAYFSPATGTTLAQLELQWSTPLNTDGSVMIDGLNYIVQYRLSTTPIYPIAWSQLQGKPWSSINGNPWTNPLDTPQNQQWTTVQVGIDNNNVIIGSLICGETYDFQIACTDVSGNTSAFSAVTQFVTAADNVAPGQPDAPTVFASMVAVQVQHDLQLNGGGALPQDLDHLEVHYSYDPSFTPVPGINSSTYLGKIIATAGMINAGIVAMGGFNMSSTTGVYIKVIAVDTSGNRSQASPGSGVTAVLIDDQHISSLSVTKLLAGTISANIVLGASIGTALSGQRVQMDNTGLHAYDSLGNIYFDLNNSSTTMTLSKSSTGQKIQLDPSGVSTNSGSASYPAVKIYDSVGSNYGYMVGYNGDSNTACIGISSGYYTVGAAQYQNQLALAGVNEGAAMAVVDINDQVAGGILELKTSGMLLGYFPTGYTHGGQIVFSPDATDSDVEYEFDGFYSAGAAPFAQEGIFPQKFSGIPSASGTSVSYGSTMYSAVMPVASYACSTIGAVGGNINASSTTGFSYSLSGSSGGTWSVFSLGLRIR